MSALSASACAAETEHGEHLFKISDYSLHRGMGVGHYIQSVTFVVGGHQWCILYYPDGFKEDRKDDMAVVLKLMDTNEDTVRMSRTISLFDWTTQRFSSRTPFTTNLSDPILMAVHYINRGEREASGGYVVDDRLTIKCAVTVVKQPRVFEPANSDVMVPPSDITEHLAKLLESKDDADVIFEVQGEEFPAHKLVLAMRSPVFEAELYGPMRKKDSNHIVIDDMQTAIFKVLLHFIYTDSLPVMDDFDGNDKKEMTRHLLVAADLYGMERLKLVCESILCKEHDVESVATTYALRPVLLCLIWSCGNKLPPTQLIL